MKTMRRSLEMVSVMEKVESREFSKYQIIKLLDKMFSLYTILTEAGYKINEFGNTFCPFHENEETPAAKYYPNTDTLHCFSEGKTFHVADALSLTGQDYITVFYDKWATYSDKRKEELLKTIDNDINIIEESVKFKSKLELFKDGKCSYQDLCVDIAKTCSASSIELLEKLYNISHELKEATVGSDDYTFIAWRCGLKHIRSLSLTDVVKSNIELPRHISKFFQSNIDCLIIFNMCGKVPLSCIIRGVKTKKFTNIGNAALFYGLCSLNKNFKYGDRLTVVEGPKDCETYRNIFNDKNCVAMNTAPISRNKALILKYLTDNIVLAQDNDKAGEDAKNKFKRYYSKAFKINEFYHDSTLKDFGDLIPLLRNNYDKATEVIRKYKIKIDNFI